MDAGLREMFAKLGGLAIMAGVVVLVLAYTSVRPAPADASLTAVLCEMVPSIATGVGLILLGLAGLWPAIKAWLDEKAVEQIDQIING